MNTEESTRPDSRPTDANNTTRIDGRGEVADRDEGIAERFQQETANHQMTVKHDDGPYRHIRFMDPKYSGYWFDLITVPGALIFQGDGETFAFHRIDDMFQFFRSGIWKDGSLHTNPDYWAEKLTSDRDSVMQYDEELFAQQVGEALAEAEKDYPGITDAWNTKTDGMFPEYDTSHEHGAREALDDFEFGVVYRASCACGASEEFVEEHHATRWRMNHITPGNAQREHGSTVKRIDGFEFTDTWDWDLKGYHWWFLWALHGIVWGIAQYDASKAAARPADAEAVAS